MAIHRLSVTRAREMQDLESELKARLAGDVRFDRYSRILYSTDASIYQMMPIGVAIPRNREDVLAALELAQAKVAELRKYL